MGRRVASAPRWSPNVACRAPGPSARVRADAWAVGYGAAVLVTAIVLRWRGGAPCSSWACCGAPHGVGAPERQGARDLAGGSQRAAGQAYSFRDNLQGPDARADRARDAHDAVHDVRVVGVQFCGFRPTSSSGRQGGLGLGRYAMVLLAVMQAGMWFGYVTFASLPTRSAGSGPTSPTSCRRRPRPGLHHDAQRLGAVRARAVCRVLRTGYFSGFGAVTAEIYPRPCARRRRGSPTTSAGSPVRRRPGPWDSSRKHTDSGSRS